MRVRLPPALSSRRGLSRRQAAGHPAAADQSHATPNPAWPRCFQASLARRRCRAGSGPADGRPVQPRARSAPHGLEPDLTLGATRPVPAHRPRPEAGAPSRTPPTDRSARPRPRTSRDDTAPRPEPKPRRTRPAAPEGCPAGSARHQPQTAPRQQDHTTRRHLVTYRDSDSVAEEPGLGLVAGMPDRLLRRQGVLA